VLQRSAMKMALVAIIFILVAYIGLSVYGAHSAMEIPRLAINMSPISMGLAYEDVAFASRVDGVVLKGWYLRGTNDSVIVIVHGGFQNRVDDNANTLTLARDLISQGFSLLLFDLRGRGESEGQALSLSNTDRDIGGAVDYLKSRGYTTRHIGLMGFCSGAAAVAIFASQEQVQAILLDGCFARVKSIFIAQAALAGIPGFLSEIFYPGVLLMARVFYGYEIINPLDIIPAITCPILFIHEERDETVPVEDVQQLLQASSNPANELWEVPNAKHSQGYTMLPSEYIDLVSSFFFSNVK
jgi:dienelactone hydrolase